MKYSCFWIKMLFILMISLSLAACGGGGGGGDADDSGGDTTVPGETSAMKKAASEVEEAFISGVPANLLDTLSAESRTFYEEGIDIIAPDMADFGNDFKNRKLIYATDNYAEYEFTSYNETFTVTFARQDDGTWKLTRF